MKKLQLVLMALLICLALPVTAADQSVVDSYNKSCIACHASGAAGAPRTGVAADWQPRLSKGMDVLVTNAINGINAMPPKGMCFDCSDAELKALIEYMVTPK